MEEIARARTPRGGQRPPPRPVPLACGDCPYVTFDRDELQDHFTKTGHQKPAFLQRLKKSSIEVTLAIVLIIAGAILFGAVLAAIIWSAKILVLLGIPAALVLIWWIRRG